MNFEPCTAFIYCKLLPVLTYALLRRIIWFGDLNYRINLPYEKAREHIAKKQWTELIEKDQV